MTGPSFPAQGGSDTLDENYGRLVWGVEEGIDGSNITGFVRPMLGSSAFTDGDSGVVPRPTSANYLGVLKAMGEWSTIESFNMSLNSVTFAVMQNIATNKLIGRATAGTGDPEEITCTAAGRALIDDADAAAQRVTLEIGKLIRESISGAGTIANATQLAVCSGTSYTVNLPSASTVGSGWTLIVKRTSSGNITLDASGSQTIDGALTYVLTVALSSITLVSDGSNWDIV